MNRFVLSLIVTLGVSEGSGPARAREQTLPTGDGYRVRAIAFSPDGKLLLTGHGAFEPSLFARGHIKVWDVRSGKQLAQQFVTTFYTFPREFSSLEVSPWRGQGLPGRLA